MNQRDQLSKILDRCSDIAKQDFGVNHIYDTIKSVEKRKKALDEEIAVRSVEAAKTQDAKDALIREKQQLGLLMSCGNLMKQFRGSMGWLWEKYPETQNMTFMQTMDFVDGHKEELRDKLMEIRNELRNKAHELKLYKNLLIHQAVLRTRIDELEYSYAKRNLALIDLGNEVALTRELTNLRDSI
jgi:hypothetical protein